MAYLGSLAHRDATNTNPTEYDGFTPGDRVAALAHARSRLNALPVSQITPPAHAALARGPDAPPFRRPVSTIRFRVLARAARRG
jgi:hypothetical protein